MTDSALARPRATAAAEPRRGGGRLLAWGAAAVIISAAVYAAGWAAGWLYLTPQPLDLQIYVAGGLIVRHVAPLYDPHLASPLYGWTSIRGWMFTYTPFAAVVFALISFLPWSVLPALTVAVSLVCLAASLWLVLHALGYRGRACAGAALLGTAVLIWTEPVQRTLLLGQVNLVLMLAVLLDLCLPDEVAGRWWKGAGIGIAAGIKLVPLVFIPYLLLTRRFREAGVATGVFLATIGLGFVVIPRDSSQWWFHGLFLQGSRTGFIGVMQNQSLRGLITRLAGSVAAGEPGWLVAAVLVGAAGVVCAALLDRAGQPVLGILACALTGLLISPISWDHHWVWIAPGLVVLAHYSWRAWRLGQRRAAAALAALTVVTWGAFAAWPVAPWMAHSRGDVGLDGLIWMVPSTPETLFSQVGDQRWLVEYHYQGLDFVGGNLYILVGGVLFALLIGTAVRLARAPGQVPVLLAGEHP
jgi:alpha-1,2-mannosyltransferase